MNSISDIELFFNIVMQFQKLMLQHAQESYEDRTATILQLSVLQSLIEQPKRTVGEVALFMRISKSSATQLIERLVKAGLVTRVDDSIDRRIIRLNITQKGKKEFFILKKKVMGKMQKIFSKIPAKDTRELIRIHMNLVEVLQKEYHE